MKLVPLLAGAFWAVVMPSAASACRVGGDAILFSDAPSGYESLPKVRAIRVHFTNVGPLVQEWSKRKPWSRHGGAINSTLIGVARLQDRSSKPFPVYATVTSCTHGFWSMAFGKADPVWNGDYYVVGQFQSEGGHRYFRAAGNWNGKWHY